MAKAHEVASELRRLADALEKNPDSTVPRPFIFFDSAQGDSSKEQFLRTVAVLPRPLQKRYSDHDFKLEYDSPNAHIWATIPRNNVCRLVKPAMPAEYECDPLLSQEEEDSLVEA